MKVLSQEELRTVKGIRYSRNHIHRLVKAGKFPRPIKLGENANAWVEDEVDAYLKGKIAERDRSATSAAA
jgi:prophage regulatory protein